MPGRVESLEEKQRRERERQQEDKDVQEKPIERPKEGLFFRAYRFVQELCTKIISEENDNDNKR